MSVSGKIIKTAASSKVVLIVGLREAWTVDMGAYKEALRDINEFVEFEVLLERDNGGLPYRIIVPDELFKDINDPEGTID